MSEVIFNHNLNRIRQLRDLKGQNLSVVIDSRLPHLHGRTLFLSKDGQLTTDLLLARFDVKADDSLIIENSHYCLNFLYDSDIEHIVQETMSENEKHMDHLSFHPEDWTHVE